MDDGARARLSYEDVNFLARAWTFASGLSIGSRESFAYADVFFPPTAKGYRDSIGLLAVRSDTQGLITDSVSAAAERFRIQGRIENRYRLNLLRERAEPSGEVATSTTTLALGWSWTYRDIDNLVDPRDGYVVNVQLGGAAKALLSDQNFLRGYGRVQVFHPLGANNLAIVRAELGYVAAPDRSGIPETYLFRTGGTQSVRGYAYQSLGVQEADAVVGGRLLGTASGELVHWFTDRWGGAVFADIGDAADKRDDLRARLGYGVGARWRSPAGPLALDVAYGEDVKEFRVHFAVAIAF
jgi:translocation and assembly module TamA